MDPLTVVAFCPSSELARIESIIREWPDVNAVGSLRAKERKKDITNVFIKFNSEDAVKSAPSRITKVYGLSLTDERSEKKEKGDKSIPRKGRSKTLAIELLNCVTHDKSKNTLDQQRKRDIERGKKNCGNRSLRNQNGLRESNYNEGYRRRHPFVPPAQVNVAVVDNIPFNMTNDQLIEVFSPFGRVFDINRYEMMAMIFYDSPECVSQCIQQLNGKTIRGNVISVSSGYVRIPGHVAVQMGL
ncbi:RNA-binding protein [Trypanosoma rangeli]|uniref:RNA-binding protein n=1 Tax=Trypanosoma rangeli TaxID=5698 RepID=A0A3R7MFN4_TRYRA|nr:RNA-binding protein [Trypanosoma rangeli]RNF01643.1 RNA-binding protein [Trypanosoma rangeli]|eukprot:RNF01643.1 RNA-binding protein [Trypanosoma rangeli]